MSSEVSVVCSLNIRGNDTAKANINLNYQNQPTAFRADMTGGRGPTPGNVLVAVGGTDVSLAALSNFGGWCRIMNLDATNWVDYGIYDSAGTEYFPLGELLAGEQVILRLSRKLGQEYTGTGTGMGGTTLHFRANTAACNVIVEAFDK